MMLPALRQHSPAGKLAGVVTADHQVVERVRMSASVISSAGADLASPATLPRMSTRPSSRSTVANT